jgi:hypothetical protein
MIAQAPTRCGFRSVIHGAPRGDDPEEADKMGIFGGLRARTPRRDGV